MSGSIHDSGTSPERDGYQTPAGDGGEGAPAAEGRGERVAFFGGSFDPPHHGHLAIARAAREGLQLDRVLFAPVGAQPLKPQGSTASFEDRVAMTRAAVAGERGFEVSLVDAPNPEGRPNYTLDTLRNLREKLPREGALYCLMGADSFLSLKRWHGAAEVPFAGWLIVASRPGQRLDDLTASLPEGVSLNARVAAGRGGAAGAVKSETEVRSYRVRDGSGRMAPFYLLPGLDVEISASEIRKQIGCCFEDPAATRGLLTPAVAEYIRAHGLYR